MREFSAYKAAATGDQKVDSVVLKITEDVSPHTDAIPTGPGWENDLDLFYDDQANQVHAALKVLPMATRHRLLAKQLLEHPMLLRLAGADYRQRPVAIVRKWSRSRADFEEWAYYDAAVGFEAGVTAGFATPDAAVEAAEADGFVVVRLPGASTESPVADPLGDTIDGLLLKRMASVVVKTLREEAVADEIDWVETLREAL